MTMHLAQGLTTTRTTKRKKKPITASQMQRYEEMWRKHNKDCRKRHLHDFQFEKLEDFVKYMRGEWRPKRRTETVMNTPWHYSGPGVVRETPNYPSLGSGKFSPCTKKEPMQYTGDRKLIGIATMHKSNMVPIFADDDDVTGKKQATEIATMRRN